MLDEETGQPPVYPLHPPLSAVHPAGGEEPDEDEDGWEDYELEEPSDEDDELDDEEEIEDWSEEDE